MSGKDLARLAAAVLLGAAIALPIGMMLGGHDDTKALPGHTPAAAPFRAIYSPKVLSDPYFLAQQRKGAEALEQHCRRTGELCAEARQARHWLDQHRD